MSTFKEFFGKFADQCHHGKEEEILFPLLETHGVPKAGALLGVMLGEHKHGRSLVRQMGEASEDYASGVKVSTED